MIRGVRVYVDSMTTVSKAVGNFAMYLVFGMIGILFFETVSRTVFNHPWIWTVEMAQFVMAAYYTLGGAYTLILGGHVQMDLLYGGWTRRRKARVDAFTFAVAMLYLAILFYGGVQGLRYSIKYKQVSYSAWAPPVTPIKIIMLIGILVMILQVIAEFFRDLVTATKKEPPQ